MADTTLRDLIQRTARDSGESQDTVRRVLLAALDAVGEELVEGRSLSLTNFGRFAPTVRRVPAGSLNGRVEQAQTVVTAVFRPTGRLRAALRDGQWRGSLRKDSNRIWNRP